MPLAKERFTKLCLHVSMLAEICFSKCGHRLNVESIPVKKKPSLNVIKFRNNDMLQANCAHSYLVKCLQTRVTEKLPIFLVGLSRKGMSSVMLEQKLSGKSWLKICSSRWDCSLTPPRIRSGSWAAVSAVQLCSECSLTPPRIRSGSWAAVSAV